MANGSASDVYVFGVGDGSDVVDARNGSARGRLGEIHFSPDVDSDSISFGFRNGDAFIHYADGDQITLNTDTVEYSLLLQIDLCQMSLYIYLQKALGNKPPSVFCLDSNIIKTLNANLINTVFELNKITTCFNG